MKAGLLTLHDRMLSEARDQARTSIENWRKALSLVQEAEQTSAFDVNLPSSITDEIADMSRQVNNADYVFAVSVIEASDKARREVFTAASRILSDRSTVLSGEISAAKEKATSIIAAGKVEEQKEASARQQIRAGSAKGCSMLTSIVLGVALGGISYFVIALVGGFFMIVVIGILSLVNPLVDSPSVWKAIEWFFILVACLVGLKCTSNLLRIDKQDSDRAKLAKPIARQAAEAQAALRQDLAKVEQQVVRLEEQRSKADAARQTLEASAF